MDDLAIDIVGLDINYERIANRLTAPLHPKHADYRYKQIHVVLINWHVDDFPDLKSEVKQLAAVFDRDYAFTTVGIYTIPSKNPYSKLEGFLSRFKEEYSDQDNLLIIFYSGHGGQKNGRLIWQGYR